MQLFEPVHQVFVLFSRPSLLQRQTQKSLLKGGIKVSSIKRSEWDEDKTDSRNTCQSLVLPIQQIPPKKKNSAGRQKKEKKERTRSFNPGWIPQLPLSGTESASSTAFPSCFYT